MAKAAENLEVPVADRVVYATLLLKATALACRDVPEMNGFWIDGAFRASEAVHVGVAIPARADCVPSDPPHRPEVP